MSTCAHLAADTRPDPVLGGAMLLSAKNEEEEQGPFLGGDPGLGAGWGPDTTPRWHSCCPPFRRPA